jgi:hypothetical protein
MILIVMLGIVQSLIFIAIMILAVIIAWYGVSYGLGLNFSHASKKGLMVSIGILIGLFILDGVIFDIFKVHIISFPLFLF